jgi:DNA sulfur modification protein DndB
MPTPLQLPAIRAHIGDWNYYITSMRIADVVERTSPASELNRSRRLGHWIQRLLDTSKHARSIETYLLSQQQRFFNAVVIGVYGTDVKWLELSVTLGDRVVERRLEGALGVIELTGAETLYAIDGQHRVAGMKKALMQRPSLGEEEVGAILVTHMGKTDKGMERTRRLFSTLNRYAKPVSKMELIALDEDDLVAIVTRRLIESDSLLQKFVNFQSKSASIPKTDKHNFTTIVTLYDALDYFFSKNVATGPVTWREFKKIRPPEASIDNALHSAAKLLNLVKKIYPEVTVLQKSRADEQLAGRYRTRGGHLIFRPVGQTIVIKTITLLRKAGVTDKEIAKRLRTIPMSLSANPWRGLLWDPTNRLMMVAGEQQRAATGLFYYRAGGDLRELGLSEPKLRELLAGAQNVATSRIRLTR